MAAIQRELVALKQANPAAPPGSASPPTFSIDSDADVDADFSSETEDTSLASIKQSIRLMRRNSEERIAGIREWKRLKRIPNGSVESGVVRTYVSNSIPPSFFCLLTLGEDSWNGLRLSLGPPLKPPQVHPNHRRTKPSRTSNPS